VNPPAYSQGRVYVQIGQGIGSGNTSPYLACFSSSGSVLFTTPFGAQWENYLAPTIDNGRVYVDGGTYGGMYAFNTTTGAQSWFCGALNQYDQWTPSLDSTYAYAYLGTQYSDVPTAGLYAVNRTTGLVGFWIQDPDYYWSGWSMGEAAAISNGHAYAVNGNRLIAFDIPNRKIAWERDRAITGQVSVSGGAVYVIDAGTLSAFDATTGAFLWAWEPPAGSLSGTVILTNNAAIVGTATQTFAIDLVSHTQFWSVPVGGERSVIDGRLLIGNSTGLLTAYDILPQLSGTIALGNLAGTAEGQPITVQVRLPGTTSVIDSYRTTLDAEGRFSVDTVRVGTYDVAIKASHWLRKVVRNVPFGPSGAGGVDAQLINGDINGDNVVSLADFGLLKLAYGSSPGLPSWNPQADLNGDGFVGLADFGIFKQHSGESGDN